ncbi:hypothetical protein D3C87_1988300 [compost metagenome]
MACSGVSPSRRSRLSAKSIMRMAFFMTMPTSRNSPNSAIRVNSMLANRSASSAPTPAEGNVDKMVSGCSGLSYRMPSTR